MPTETLAARVARLEKTVAKLVSKQKPSTRPDVLEVLEKGPRKPGRDDWMKVVGMFHGDEEMKRIDEQGAAIRRAERRKARRG